MRRQSTGMRAPSKETGANPLGSTNPPQGRLTRLSLFLPGAPADVPWQGQVLRRPEFRRSASAMKMPARCL